MVNETVPKDILDKLNAGIEITGTDVDIRDLTSVSDSVEVLQDTSADCKVEVHNAVGEVLLTGLYGWDGSVWETVNTDTSNRLLVAATGDFYPVTQPVSGTFWQETQPVSATDLDIRDLTSASDSVEVLQDTASDLNAAVVNAAGTGLTTLRYGSSDGGLTWYPEKLGVLADTGTFTWETGVSNGEEITFYTVPANKILYVTMLFLSWANDAAITKDYNYLSIDSDKILTMLNPGGDDDHDALQVCPAIPFKLTAGQTIGVYGHDENSYVTGGFAGYLIST